MKQYPKPVKLPEYVEEARQNRKKEIISSAKRGLFLRLVIILSEFFGFIFFGSLSLLADAISSLFDLVSTAILIFFVKLAEKPPDTNHPFGHGRFEPLIGMQLGCILVLVGGSFLFQQLFSISSKVTQEVINPYVWMIPVFAVLILEICYQRMMKTAKKQNSTALEADAVHYRLDAATSFLAAIALILAAYFPNWSLVIDHIGAIVIAFTMIVVGLNAAWKNLNQLLDKKPLKEYFEKVKEASLKVEGVFGIEKVRIQLYGPDAHVDIDIEVDPKLSVDNAHQISQQVRAEIQKKWPAVRDVVVHIEPYYPDDH